MGGYVVIPTTPKLAEQLTYKPTSKEGGSFCNNNPNI